MKIKKFKNIEYLDLMSFVPLSWPAESVGVLKDDREERGEGQVQEPGEEAEGGEEQLQGDGRREKEGAGGAQGRFTHCRFRSSAS